MLLVMLALPAVLLVLNVSALLFVMVALPAVLVSLNIKKSLLVMLTAPAELLLLKVIMPPLLKVALPPITLMPAPLKFRVLVPPRVNVKAEAPLLKVKPPISVSALPNFRLVVLEVAKNAVPFGVAPSSQLLSLSKLLSAGVASHVAF